METVSQHKKKARLVQPIVINPTMWGKSSMDGLLATGPILTRERGGRVGDGIVHHTAPERTGDETQWQSDGR